MKLYFFRHGQAEDVARGGSDAERALTATGVARTRAAGQALKALGVAPERIYSSPLLRASQTATLLGEALSIAVEVRDEVGPGFSVDTIARLTADLGEGDSLFVGHEPDMSGTVARLIGGGDVTMKKGGLARVDVTARDPLRGTLVWLLAPRLLDALGEQ